MAGKCIVATPCDIQEVAEELMRRFNKMSGRAYPTGVARLVLRDDRADRDIPLDCRLIIYYTNPDREEVDAVVAASPPKPNPLD